MQSNLVRNRRFGSLRRQWLVVALVALGSFASALPIFSKEAPRLALVPESRLWITGTSTIHAWHSKAASFQVAFAAAPEWPTGSTDLQSVQKAITSGLLDSLEVAVDVKSMRSGKDGLDKNMYKALKAGEHPRILCAITGLEAKDLPSGALAIVATGRLTVAGVEREIKIPAEATREGDALRVKGSVLVRMKDFGIKPPVMMMGSIKTGNDVTVQFDLLVGPASGS